MIQIKQWFRRIRRGVRGFVGSGIFYKDTPWSDADIRRIWDASRTTGGPHLSERLSLQRHGHDADLGYPLQLFGVDPGIADTLIRKAGVAGRRR